MSAKANPTVIGAFTLVGLVLAGAAVVLLGAGNLFKKTHSVLLYFDKSVYGLQVGSDVRFGGVRIGSVRSISVLIDTAEDRRIIPVVVELGARDLGQIGVEEEGGIDFSTEQGVRKAVDRGLRAGMKQQSLVTGQLYIEFDIVPGSPGFVYQTHTPPPYPVVPTIGTEMDELISGIADGIRKFNALDIQAALAETRTLVANANRQIEALDLAGLNRSVVAAADEVRALAGGDQLANATKRLDDTLKQLDELAAKANQGIDPLLADLHAALANTEAGLTAIHEASREIAAVSNPRGPVLLRLQAVLSETERASRALKELTNDLKGNPKAILTGKAKPE